MYIHIFQLKVRFNRKNPNNYRKTRKGRNPQTGEKIKIKGKNVVKFKPGKTLREKI
jgi:nucleoid DNA-binding protein